MWKNGCTPEAITLLFKMVVQPCRTHDCESVFQNKVAIDRLAKYQNTLLKSSLDLKQCCQSTPLLQSTIICSVKNKIDLQELGLLRKMFLSETRTQHFYTYLLSTSRVRKYTCESIPHRVGAMWQNRGISLMRCICDECYPK